MRFTTYNPWTPIRQFQREIDRVWDSQSNDNSDTVEKTMWIPAVDINENDERWLLAAEVPGVNPQSIEITAEEGVLVLKGEKVAIEDSDGRHHSERATGRFRRQFTLPTTADTDKITATTELGVLLVTIPKQETKQAKRIEVQAA